MWTFDGPFADCLADLEDTLRRAIVQVGDVASIVVLIELSLPALKRRVDAGDSLQPAWARVPRSGCRIATDCPQPPRVRPLEGGGPARHARHRLPELDHVA